MQAGIIAQGLKENSPCPVCGSVEHPKIAQIEDKKLTKGLQSALRRYKRW